MRTAKELKAAYLIVRRSKDVGPAGFHVISMLLTEVEHAVKIGKSDAALCAALDEADQRWREFVALDSESNFGTDGFSRWIERSIPEMHTTWQAHKAAHPRA